jgi:hypothetical protein
VSTALADQIADAILYEGYVLYPYRASAAKNRVRWHVGLVTPRAYSEATASDPWFLQTECLADINPGATLTVRVRCLHVQERVIEQPVDGDEWRCVESLQLDDGWLITWDEAVVCEFTREALPLDGMPREWCESWVLNDAYEVQTVHDRNGRIAARIVRRRTRILTNIRIETEPCGHLHKIRVRVENLTPTRANTLAERDAAVRQSLAGTHTLLSIEHGGLISLLDPPNEAAALAASCINTHTFPILIGPVGSRQTMLSAPIILYDYPVVAPESPGDLCDATEIDEMLMLRVKSLTEPEKREARATDSRAAQIIERCDTASAVTMSQLHGAVRHYADAASAEDWESFLNPPGDAAPDTACVEIAGTRISRGSSVRLQPTGHADSLDMCLRGRIATVTAVYQTLEGKPYVAVTLDDDPLAGSGAHYRRSLFFSPNELVPLDADKGGAA